MFIDARWTHTFFDEADLGAPAGINVSSDEFRLGLKIKFGAPVLEDAKPAKKIKP